MRFNVAILIAVLPAVLAGPVRVPKAGDVIPDQYIVMLNEDVDDATFSSFKETVEGKAAEALAKRGLAPTIAFAHTYNFGKVKGYSGKFDAATIEEIANLPEVAFVEQDTVVSASALVTQTGAPWGLARISHRNTGFTTYIYDSTAGQNTWSYIIDTGINTAHTQFGGRATQGYSAISGETAADGNGHGTHVAGTVGGSTYGVAKNTNLVAVKVLGNSGSGSNSGVIAGINWVVSNAQSTGRVGRAIANMSLGGGFSSATNNAVTAAVAAGIPFVVAAGNSNQNAANFSPASTPNAITVGSTTSTDARSSFSNFGANLDIFAPGSSIISAWIGSTTATNTISGTSMASPHVCGLGAYLMSYEGITTPSALINRIIALNTPNKVTSPGTGSPNRLAYNGNGA